MTKFRSRANFSERTVEIGVSFENRTIKGIKFRSLDNSVPYKYKIGLLANMHGNEATGREILAWFIEYFCENESSSLIQHLLAGSEIIVIPTINPDGFQTRMEVIEWDEMKICNGKSISECQHLYSTVV